MMTPLKSAVTTALLFFNHSIRTRRTWIVIGLVLIDVVIAIAWNFKDSDDVQSDVNGLAKNVILGFIVPFVALFYGTAVIRDEVEGGTISYLFTRPISRASFVIGRTVCAFLAVALTGITLALANPLILTGSVQPDALLPVLSAVLLASFAYTALFALVGGFLKRPFLFGLMLLLFFDFTVSEIPVSARFITIKAHATNIAGLHERKEIIAAESLSVIWSVLALAITGISMLAATVAVVRTREYTTTD